ncbi:MAG TPA: hypothetical protein VHX36_11880 [Candidatus Acidoferrales bacterium]|jgi:uncharacterized protein with von Willebrand factor type A (vWA) domain|nr:hypothetical protein [Candidatus Acidoferrales bacterium]
MSHTSIDWKNVRTQLAKQRKELFELLEKNPENIRLAAEIKRLDDQISECSERIQRERPDQDGAMHLLS